MADQPSNTILYDEWLSRVLGKKTYAIVWNDLFFDGFTICESQEQKELERLLREQIFMYAKIPAEQMSALHCLESYGFNVVENALVFRKALHPRQRDGAGAQIRNARPEDEAAVYELAGHSFSYSRFHLDRRFSNALANNVKSEWTRSYFRCQRGNVMLVALLKEEIAGFILLADGVDNNIAIDLMAVDPAYRRKKIATGLLSAAENFFPKYPGITVGTQAANIPSVRLYEKNGFRLASSHYVLHYHGQNRHVR